MPDILVPSPFGENRKNSGTYWNLLVAKCEDNIEENRYVNKINGPRN